MVPYRSTPIAQQPATSSPSTFQSTKLEKRCHLTHRLDSISEILRTLPLLRLESNSSHQMIFQPFPNTFQLDLTLHPDPLQIIFRTDPTCLQQLGSVERSKADDHFLLRFGCVPRSITGLSDFDTGYSCSGEEETSDDGGSEDVEVWSGVN